MLTFWIKPKWVKIGMYDSNARKHRQFWVKSSEVNNTAGIVIKGSYLDSDIYKFLLFGQMMLTMIWFSSIPFLFLAYGETIGVFKNVTILLIIAELLAKLTHPTRKYFF
jgi:hypothetical protein